MELLEFIWVVASLAGAYLVAGAICIAAGYAAARIVGLID